VTQGKHTDRLLTVCYLPTNLIVIAAMVHWHGRIRTRLRITAGLLGFTLALVGVVWVRPGPAQPLDSCADTLLVADACSVPSGN
jgi:equilibrative nucleoside transporter 1/2/3